MALCLVKKTHEQNLFYMPIIKKNTSEEREEWRYLPTLCGSKLGTVYSLVEKRIGTTEGF